METTRRTCKTCSIPVKIKPIIFVENKNENNRKILIKRANLLLSGRIAFKNFRITKIISREKVIFKTKGLNSKEEKGANKTGHKILEEGEEYSERLIP
jgi:hypothetical protein